MSRPDHSDSIFSKQIHPFRQLAVCAVLIIVIMLAIRMVSMYDVEIKGSLYWESGMAILMGFALFNSIFSIPYKNRNVYFRDSIFSFMAVAAVGGLCAYWFSGLSMDEAGSFRWLYFVFGFSYLVFISIVNMMRKIIEIAKKQDARLRGED